MASIPVLVLFKFTVTPILVGLASLAARRWGNTVAGLLTGFPLMTAPISIFLTIEEGPAFSIAATTGIHIALIGVATYSICYVLMARLAAWPIAILVAYGVFCTTSWAAQHIVTTQTQAALAAYGAILLAVIVMPRGAPGAGPTGVPYWEIWLRMLATAAMIALVTSVAGLLGPTWTGIVSTVPVMGTILATFTHARHGADAVATFLRSMMLSMFSFATFFVVVGLALASVDILSSYVLATVIAVGLSPFVIRLDKMSRRTANT